MHDSGYERAEHAYYVEPRWLVDALLDVETFEGRCYDPSCGAGNIPKALNERGIRCVGSDIADRGYGIVNTDFFTVTKSPAPNIVSNPPFNVMEEYAKHAISLTTGKVALVGRLAFLEGQKRRPFLEKYLSRVWVSSRRASMPPGGTDIPPKGGTIAMAWYIFDPLHVGKPTVNWL